MTEGMISGSIFIKKSCEAKLEFEIVIPGSAIRHTTDCAMEPGKIKFSGFPQITPVLANLISYTLIRPMVKIKIENFQVFDIQWLYRTSRYAIVKVDITERNDVTKCHSFVITIRWMPAIK